MVQVSPVLRRLQGGYGHWCPGCQEMHRIPDRWEFNGDFERPTFLPSVKHTGKRCVIVDGRWTGEWVRDAEGKPLDDCCHYFLMSGRINFCGDCVHPLAGQNVALPPLPDWLTDETWGAGS